MSIYYSTTTTANRLSSQLNNQLNIDHQYRLEEDGWVQFLYDYRDFIKANSDYRLLNEATMNRFQYRIRDYLLDLGLPGSLDQAFKIVNRLGGDIEFNHSLTGVYVPRVAYLTKLKRAYSTLKTKCSKL